MAGVVNINKIMAHDHQILDVRKNGAFIFNDILLVDFRQQKLGDLLKDVIAQRNHLTHMVKRYMSEDARIVGQEKANVVNVLHVLVRSLSALFMKLYDQQFASEFVTKLTVSEGKEGFLIQGKMDPNEVNVHFSLEKWVSEYLDDAISHLVKDFQAAIKDHEISVAEKVQLVADLDNLLLQCLQAFYLMRTGAVFS